jgi:hypothetical protein
MINVGHLVSHLVGFVGGVRILENHIDTFVGGSVHFELSN